MTWFADCELPVCSCWEAGHLSAVWQSTGGGTGTVYAVQRRGKHSVVRGERCETGPRASAFSWEALLRVTAGFECTSALHSSLES